MAANTAALVSTSDVARAKAELAGMKRSLASWLKYRTLNDSVIAGTAPTKKPKAYAQTVVSQARDWALEQRLAKQLHVLLSESFPDAQLPEPDIQRNPQAAVELARIAIVGPGSKVNAPGSQGAIAWWWPAIIVGGLLLAITTAIKTSAETAREKERIACIQAGACTDYGFWLKAGGVAALAWVGWVHMGLGEKLKGALKGKRS